MTSVPKLRKALKSSSPGLSIERRLWAAGHDNVVGVDEVGRGSWAGPLTIGAVVVPVDRRIYKLRDSKQLKEPEREALFERIIAWCRCWSIGHASAAECDRLGMSDAQRLAARRAIAGLGVEPSAVILDGKWDFVGHPVTEKLVKGDSISLSIAAASILAKVTRDRMMRSYAASFPMYEFEKNKGYPSPAHRTALHGYGGSAIHRMSWSFADDLPWSGQHRPKTRSGQLSFES